MITKWEVLFYSAIFYGAIFVVGKQIFDFLFSGFAPFFVSRPWVIEKLLSEISKEGIQPGDCFVSIGSGRSGLLHALEKKYPNGKYIGVEDSFWSTLISRTQVFLKRSKIKVLHQELFRVDVSEADLIYCKLDLKKLRELEKKFKFECKSGALILSNGFVIPNMNSKKEIILEEKKARFSALAFEFKSKMKKSKKENKVYVYEV